jgi:hypothetical protein
VPTNSPEADKLEELLDKFDPKAQNVPTLYPMSEHRAMIRTMFLDNILYATARLQKNHWILHSENERFRDCEFALFLACLDEGCGWTGQRNADNRECVRRIDGTRSMRICIDIVSIS